MDKKTSTPEVENNAESLPAENNILDLDELVEPIGQFRLNGKVYQFHQVGYLGLLEQKTIENLWAKIQELKKKQKPTKLEDETYRRSVIRILPMISDMSLEEAQESSDELPKLLNAVICFFSFRTASSVALVMRMAQIAGKGDLQSIGENISQDSIISSLKQTQQSG